MSVNYKLPPGEITIIDEKQTPSAELAAALVKCQAELQTIKTDSKAGMGKYEYTYASLTTIIEHSKPILAKHGLAISQWPGAFNNQCVSVTTRLIHASGGIMEGTLEMPCKEISPQAVGSAITYAKRYAWCAILGIPTDDDDAQKAEQKPQNQKTADSSSTTPITPAQAKRLYAIAKQKNWTDDQLKERMLKEGYASSKDIPWPDYNRVIDIIEKGPDDEIPL